MFRNRNKTVRLPGIFRIWCQIHYFHFCARKTIKYAIAILTKIGCWTLLQNCNSTARIAKLIRFPHKGQWFAEKNWLRRRSGDCGCTRRFCSTLAIEVLSFDAFAVRSRIFESFFLVLCNSLFFSRRGLARRRRRPILSDFLGIGFPWVAVATVGLRSVWGYRDEASGISGQKAECFEKEAFSECFSFFIGTGCKAEEWDIVCGRNEVRYKSNTIEEEPGCFMTTFLRSDVELQRSIGSADEERKEDMTLMIDESGGEDWTENLTVK